MDYEEALSGLITLVELDPENTPGTDLYVAIKVAEEALAALRSGELVVIKGDRLIDYIVTHNPIVLGTAREELFIDGELAYLTGQDGE